MADRKDDQIPEPEGHAGDEVPGRTGSACEECGSPLAPDQRYCLNCGHRRGRLPAAVAGTLAALSSKGKGLAAAAGAKTPKPKGEEEEEEEGGWSWMPSPAAIAIAVIGMLALGVGIGSAMSEIADSAPISTILLEYPHHATEAPPAEEPEEEVVEEEPVVAEAPEETAPEEVFEEPPPEVVATPIGEEEASGETPPPVEFNPLEEETAEPLEETLPEIKHAFVIVLGENGYEETFGDESTSPYLSRTLPKKGLLIPNYYGVTGGVLANEIALLSGQGPTAETAANCPSYDAIAPGTVAETAGQVEGTGCVYADTVQSLPTQLAEKELTWRAYVEDMEKGAEAGAPTTCRKPTLNTADPSQAGVPGDQYMTWRNPVVYFSAIAEAHECGEHDVGFEALTRDLKAKKKTPALSLIFPDACHSGGELECEPGAAKGAQGATALLKTLVPAILTSPAYEKEGGMIVITSAQALQAGEKADPSGCCLAPSYPNLAATSTTITTPSTSTSTSTTEATTATEEEAEPTTYSEESVTESGGGGKVGLLIISPYVEADTVEETVYANHFTLLKTLEGMFGVEPLGYAGEEEMPALSPSLFKTSEEVEEALKKKASSRSAKG